MKLQQICCAKDKVLKESVIMMSVIYHCQTKKLNEKIINMQGKNVLRAGNQRFLSELLVYLKNCPPRLVLICLTIV